jgi:hypothetical protein
MPSGFGLNQVDGNNFMRYKDFFVFSYAGLGFARLNLIGIAPDYTLSLYDQARSFGLPDYEYQQGVIVPLGGGYILGPDGVTLLEPPLQGVPLSEIVSDISELCGLYSYDIDVSDLPDIVDGYIASQQGSGRDWIRPLRDAWAFDAFEGEVVTFVKRGKPAVVTIPDDDLAAHVYGEDPPVILGTVRGDELALPRAVNVSFMDAAADYQTGTQPARRQVTRAQSEVSLNLPINMTNAKGKSVAEMQLYTAHIERDRHKFYTSRKYAKYTPTDVVSVRGRELRVTEKNEVHAGVIQWDAVASVVQSFNQPGIAATRLSFTSSPPSVVMLPTTTLYMFDLPLVSDSDEPNGIYAAMAGTAGWPGAALMKSNDGGSTYATIGSTSAVATIGTASTVLANFYGGNVFDESNVVTVVLTSGELSNATEIAVLGGANEAVLGNEVFNFKNADLVDVDTYELSGLLRGRLGTEWAMGSHVVNERFAVLPLLRVPAPLSEINQVRQYKPVTFGATIGSAAAQSFANSGESLKPYSPVHLGGGTDASGNVTINWTRRTRIGGGWMDFVDAPLSEASERYVVQIWDASYLQCARIIETTAQTATYSSADQVTDFGAQQAHIYFTVGQIGAIGIGHQARGVAVGHGSTDDLPLAEIPPYANSPNNPIDGGHVDTVLDWDSSSGAIISPLARGYTWVGQFTVGGTPPTSGSIGWAEYGAAPTIRRVRFCTSADGTGVLAEAYSGIGSIAFGSSTTIPLSAATTYYLRIQSGVTPDGVVSGSGDCSMIVFLNHTP